MQELDKDNLKPQKKKTILLVCDDVSIVRLYCKVFSKHSDFNVKHTEDVEEILRIVQAREADLVLIDLYYVDKGKELGGSDIMKMLRVYHLTTNIPVILMKDRSMRGDFYISLEKISTITFISKPIYDMRAFVERIRAELN